MKNYPLARPKITQADIKAVTQVLESTHLSRGPVVAAFEKEMCQLTHTYHACAVSSGTAGLIMALQALGVTKGDEVITVSFTVPATVNSIVAIGATPVMVDIETETLGMCPDSLQQAITAKTKAIIVVHAFGKAAQIKNLIGIAHQYQIKVIEDACEAIGNQYLNKTLGSFADIGVFAFYPNKQITTGEGGMLVTNHQDLADKFQLLRNHGRSMNGDLYDQICFGWNFRLSDINAALGLSQIQRLKSIIQKRKNNAHSYHEYLKDNTSIVCPKFSSNESHSAWFVYVIQIKNADRVKTKLQNQGIHCGRYFAPVHLQPYYRKKFPQLTLKNTEMIAQQTLALPFYHDLKHQDIAFICDSLVKSSL
jgi:perosamine synthetase